MQTSGGLPSNMVAVGSKKTGTAAHTATTTAQIAIPQWTVREGRGTAFALWENALGDALPRLGLQHDNLQEQPPTRPTGDALSVESQGLWSEAVKYFQDEGTALFDVVRPSLVIDGPYAMQDLRRISLMQRDGVKDGRALVRLALGFADRSGIKGQMALVNDINKTKLNSQSTLFQLSEHVTGLWKMWLALTGSSRAEPASFFWQMLVSMPTEPECPVVALRRWLVDMFDRGDSPLLADIDGEDGLLTKIVSYGESLGVQDVRPSLHLLQTGGREGGGATMETTSPSRRRAARTTPSCTTNS